MDEMQKTNQTPAPADTAAESCAPETPAKRTFAPSETVFAWLCFLAGYLFFRVIPVHDSPLGALLFVLALFVGTAVFLRMRGTVIATVPAVLATVAAGISVSLILCANRHVTSLAFTFVILTYLYFVGTADGSGVARGFSGLLAADYLNASLILPFASFGSAVRAAFSGRIAKNSGKTLVKILCGATLALVPTVAVAVLLSYDDGFTELMHKIFSADVSFADIFSQVNSVLFGFLVGMYVFGLYVSAHDKKCTATLTEKNLHGAASALRRLPTLTVLCATVPLLFIYVVFFISQWQYYTAAFSGIRPEAFTYAEYAREGFFNLCAVAFINLCVITAAALFLKRKTEEPPAVLKVLSVLYSVFTLVLIATAISKMVMYIGAYGLTQKRVYASVMMIWLGILFAVLLLKQFLPRMRPAAVSFLTAIVLFSAVSLGNADALIARYNVDRYLDGTLDEVDVVALYELGDAAIPEMVRLARIESEKLGVDVKTMIEKNLGTQLHRMLSLRLKNTADARTEALKSDDRGAVAKFFAFNLPEAEADAALCSIGLIE